jgi:hypothetical protein
MSEVKTKKRWNVLDIAVIVLVLFALVGLWQRQNLKNIFTTDEMLERYTVTFEIRKVRSTTIDQLGKGEMLYIEQGEEQVTLGTLS